MANVRATRSRFADRHRPHAAHVLTIPAPPPEPSISVNDLLALHRALVGDDYSRLESRLVWHVDSARLDTGYELGYRPAFGVLSDAVDGPLAGRC
jgi:hypothetical protein